MTAGPHSPDTASQVGTGAAMRARDVSRPSAEDLETAEREVVVSYRPPSTTSSRRGGNSPEAS
jgi:hypothetical protein